MLLATVAIACLGNYIFRAVIVVRILIIYPLSPNPPPVALMISNIHLNYPPNLPLISHATPLNILIFLHVLAMYDICQMKFRNKLDEVINRISVQVCACAVCRHVCRDRVHSWELFLYIVALQPPSEYLLCYDRVQ